MKELSPLLVVIRDLTRWFSSCHVPYLVIGGVAVAILGKPRATQDVDALISLDETRLRPFFDEGPRHGFEPRMRDAFSFAEKAKVLLMKQDSTGIPVDISLALLPFEKNAISRGTLVSLGDIRFSVPTPEDLIIMKAVAHRGRDRADIEQILDVHPDVDATLILQTVKEFADVLESPEVYEELNRLLKQKEKYTLGGSVC